MILGRTAYGCIARTCSRLWGSTHKALQAAGAKEGMRDIGSGGLRDQSP
jgi:hypothetical protein